MILELKEVLPLVKMKDSIKNPIVIEGKKYNIVGILPSLTEEGTSKLRSCGVTLSDLFYLELPETYEDLQYRVDTYRINISLKYEEATA